MVKKLKRVEIV